MTNKKLYWIWGGLFILCALLGFIPEPEGFVGGGLTAVGICFFVPGSLLAHRATQSADAKTLGILRSLSLCSLVSTLVLLVLNLLSGNAGSAMGDFLYGLLVVLSAPMVCCQYWVLSLFLWACLLMVSLSGLRKIRKN